MTTQTGSTTDIVKNLTTNLEFSTTASSKEMSLGDFNNTGNLKWLPKPEIFLKL